MARTLPLTSSRPSIPPGLLRTDRQASRPDLYADVLLAADAKTSRVLDLTLPRDTTSPFQAREFVQAACVAWGMSDVVDDATVLVSELVTNAVVWAAPPTDDRPDEFEVTVSRRIDALVVTVHDNDPSAPQIRPLAAPEDVESPDNILAGLGGVGMNLWLQIPRSGSIDRDDSGKTIRFVLGSNGGR